MRLVTARSISTVLALIVVAPIAASANDLSEVQGAWAVEDMSCSDVFESDHDRIILRKRDDDTLPGFIVEGRSVRGVGAQCNIVAIHPRADGISVLLSCASRIMIGNLKLTLKIPDAHTLIQADAEFPDITTRYHKCN